MHYCIVLFVALALIGALNERNAVEAAKAMTVNITVSDAPKLVNVIEEINNPEDTNATITCSVGSGQLQGLIFEWFKDNKRIQSGQIERYVIDVANGNFLSTLRIHQLKPSDSGSYSCLAKNRFGQDRISTRLNVRVQLKWTKEPSGEAQVSAGRAFHVPCEAEGKPEPDVQWIKLANSSDSASYTLGSSLRFSSIQQEDAGYYECRASNGVEEDLVARIRIDVLGK